MTPQLHVIDPGLATTVQDRGRFGLARYGVPPAGALDAEALAVANALVGNDADEAALECRWTGPTLAAEGGPVRLAIAGCAAPRMTLTRAGEAAGETVPAWRSLTLAPGDRLAVGALAEGTTATIAVAGGLDLDATLGSRSSLARAGLGGFDGRALAAGDRLPARGPAPGGPEREVPRPPAAPPAEAGVRGVLGPQRDHFTDAAVETLLSTRWEVSRASDRMGLRLDGPAIEHSEKGANITSDGIVTGTIQVPGSGQPILLLVDRGVSGGYPKIACAVSADLALLGRLGPGDVLRFEAVDAAEGARLAREAARRVERLIASIAPARAIGIDEAALWRENLITGRVDDF
ncbi:MAG: biotin-dependent carboxyltransferase family protein [Paracoccaceae bacterium]